MSAVNFVDEMERDRSRQRVTDAMVRKAKAGYVTGGRCFGYTNVPVFGPAGERSHTTRIVNEAEACVVRRIFGMCAAGQGVKVIAKTLNAEGAPSPQPVKGRPRGWAPSSVRAVLYRRTYLGEIRYGMTAKRDRWGQRRYHKRPATEWLSVDQPAWRIVTDAQWEAAHRRLQAAQAT
jgi:site-specific DNA recombinase